jgi:hypothetical protein
MYAYLHMYICTSGLVFATERTTQTLDTNTKDVYVYTSYVYTDIGRFSHVCDCVHVRTGVCICVYMVLHVCVCAYISHVHISMYMWCKGRLSDVCVCVYVCVCVRLCVCVCVCVCSKRRAGRLHVQGGLHRCQRCDVSELQPRDIQGSTGLGSVQFLCQRLGSYSYEPIPRTYSTLYEYICVHVHMIHAYMHTYRCMCMHIHTAHAHTHTQGRSSKA